MRTLIFSLVLAAVAGAQELPAGVPQQTCYALRTYQVQRSEKVQSLSPPRVTTCTPAGKFRVKYLPETVKEREVRKAACPECAVNQRSKNSPPRH